MFALLACAGATACQSDGGAFVPEQPASPVTGSGILGAGALTIAGPATIDAARERGKVNLVAKVGGGLIGSSVGVYMDEQESELRKKLRGTGVAVARDGEVVALNLPASTTFATGDATVNPDFLAVLDAIGAVLAEYKKTLVVIAGHDDNLGEAADNQRLSEQRAEAVAHYLALRNVSTSRLVVIGYGDLRPVADNESVEGRQRNRRVELTLEPIVFGRARSIERR